MLSADSTTPHAAAQAQFDADDEGPVVGLTDILTWLGERKRLIGAVTLIDDRARDRRLSSRTRPTGGLPRRLRHRIPTTAYLYVNLSDDQRPDLPR